MSSQKVLFITYHFPPDAAVGSIRSAKFVKYLSQLGWEPIIVTIRHEHIVLSDCERLKDVEHIPIVRTRMWPTILQLALRVRDACVTNANKDGGCNPASLSINAPGDSGFGVTPTRQFSFLSEYFASLFEIPDKQIGWLIPAVWGAYWLIKKHDIRLVVTSSPPRTTALVGLVLSYLTNSSVFTDLRDPWFRPIGESLVPQTTVATGIMGWLEEKIMERSTRVITTTDNYHSYLRSFYEGLPESKFRTISNGYDEEDLSALEAIQPEGKFLISYLGTFYFGRTPKSFLHALSELVKQGQLDKSRLEVRFVGDVRYAEGESVEHLIGMYDLTGCVKTSDPVSYTDALITMKRSNVLLLFAPDQYYCIPGKAFEYLGSQNNILCFSQNGATADLVRETGSGAVVEPDNIQQIKSAILRFYAEYKQGPTNQSKNDITRFGRKTLTVSLSQLLETCISDSTGELMRQ